LPEQSDRLARCPNGVRQPSRQRTFFLTDLGGSGFRARFAPERDHDLRRVTPTPCLRDEDRRVSQGQTFTIITTRGNQLIEPIHDRMPVILDERAAEDWMNPGERDQLQLKSLLVPAPDDNLL
jgi:hypothetical protein